MSNPKKIPTHVGELGDHPLGGAVGAALGATAGAALAGASSGAAIGSAAGAPGLAAGIAIGGVVGALAGKGVAQDVNPTTEDAYWEENYRTRDYVPDDADYDTYRPAYRHGINAYGKFTTKNFDEIDANLSREWESVRDDSDLSWEDARPAARDAFERLQNRK